MSTGEVKQLCDVRIGDRVRVSSSQFSPIYFLSHANSHIRLPVVRVQTDSMAELYASGGHLIHVAATNKPSLSSKTTTSTTLVPMSSVQVGQTVMVNGSLQTVTSVTRAITKHGRFNPHTLHGDIVVNSFAVSSFTTAVHPTVANILLTPFRFLFHIVPPSHHAWLSSTNTAVNHMINAMYWRE